MARAVLDAAVADSETLGRRSKAREIPSLARNHAKRGCSETKGNKTATDENTLSSGLSLLCCLVAEISKQKGYLSKSVKGIYRGAIGNSETPPFSLRLRDRKDFRTT